MTDRDKHIDYLFASELQFRLASAVRLATNLGTQPLDLPMEWTHGEHSVKYTEIALRSDQAVFAAQIQQKSATYQMAVVMKDAIRAVIADPKSSNDPEVRAAYQITRMIRNSFAHRPLEPIWSIDSDCRDQVFEIKGVIKLNTNGLNRKPFDWKDYGGPLAMFRLCRFVRTDILKDSRSPRKLVPIPKKRLLQVGDLILQQIDSIPSRAKPVEHQTLPDGSVSLGSGYYLRPRREKEE